MRLRFYFLFLICIAFTSISAQTLDQARSMFSKGEYENAKPAFSRFVKSQPANANYNYWYGVCCFETGKIEESVKHLEIAHKKKVQNASPYLGKAYNHVYRFEDAIKVFEEYISSLQKKKQSTEEAQELLERSRANARMLKGVEDVCVIDSFVVDKTAFLHAYKLSEESGTLHSYNDFFKTQGNDAGTVYETELKNRIYYSVPGEDNSLNIYAKNKMLDEWGSGYLLPGSINDEANANYPFVLTDGITIYYASDGDNSMGGYDIYVTRYNTGTETFLAPENVGMPFNSPYNDYMYAIDEFNNLGWFATDRFQSEGKVCVYVFVPNTSRLTYNYESMEPDKLRSLAQLRSIEDTWKSEEVVTAARKRLEAVINRKPQKEEAHDFEFIINDNLVYHSADNFKSQKAKQLFNSFLQKEKDYKQQTDKLDAQRKQYAESSKENQGKMAPAIIDLEKRVQEMLQELGQLEIQVRNEEIQTIKK